jgi:hypothetical protein
MALIMKRLKLLTVLGRGILVLMMVGLFWSTAKANLHLWSFTLLGGLFALSTVRYFARHGLFARLGMAVFGAGLLIWFAFVLAGPPR